MTMKHDFSDPAYRDSLLNLFTPLTGGTPPTLAGREETLRALDELLLSVEMGNAPGHDAVLYGPLGHGKTALLKAFERRCREEGMDIVSLLPDELDAPSGLARAKALAIRLLNAPGATFGLRGTKLSLPFDCISWEQATASDLLRILDELLLVRCRDKPMLVTVNDAHRLDPAIGRQLLKLSHKIRRQRGRFLLVLAGEFDLFRSNLEKMISEATKKEGLFIECIDVLDWDSTREALETPLASLGIRFDQWALNEVIEDSGGHPYFIQIWGKALCQVLVESGHTHWITEALVQAAKPEVEAYRADSGIAIIADIEEHGLLPFTRLLASAFGEEDEISEVDLEDYLSQHSQHGYKYSVTYIRKLSALGYIWYKSDEDGHNWWRPAFPSLMDFVRDHEREEAG